MCFCNHNLAVVCFQVEDALSRRQPTTADLRALMPKVTLLCSAYIKASYYKFGYHQMFCLSKPTQSPSTSVQSSGPVAFVSVHPANNCGTVSLAVIDQNQCRKYRACDILLGLIWAMADLQAVTEWFAGVATWCREV